MDNPIILILLFFLGICFYFIPALVARDRENSTGVLLLNLIFGWTALGWIIALIWAYGGTKRAPKGRTYKCPTCGMQATLPKGVTLLVCSNCGGRFPVE